MYDSDSIRKQLEEVWAASVLEQQLSRQERANAYQTKKIMLKAHGMQSYFEIEFAPRLLALSHEIEKLSDSHPLEQMLKAPVMIGLLGGLAEILGQVTLLGDEKADVEAHMDEEMFFTQHFTSSLSDALGGLQQKKNNLDFRR